MELSRGRFFTMIDRSIPNIHPFGNPALRADDKAAQDGWPGSPRIEELRRAWLDAGDLVEMKRMKVILVRSKNEFVRGPRWQ